MSNVTEMSRVDKMLEQKLANHDLAFRAALYVRMSTDNQINSIPTQISALNIYAAQKGFMVVRTFADEGRSGLTIDGRAALKQLIQCIENGSADFRHILVYDVSRWGRFQDVDESAHYEYVCRSKGVSVHYVSEQFENDGQPLSVILKTIKRTMAAEYSRELSDKITRTKNRLIEQGKHVGGRATYAMRRASMKADGTFGQVLGVGERKPRASDYVTLVPGPKREIKIVHQIFKMFLNNHLHETAIAKILNKKNVKALYNLPWSPYGVHSVLTNERYIGTYVTHKSVEKLGSKKVRTPSHMWTRKENAIEPIIDKDVFMQARQRLIERNRYRTDDELLDFLKKVLLKRGKLTEKIIQEEREDFSSRMYVARFGRLSNAYKRIGYQPDRNIGDYWDINASLAKIMERTEQSIIAQLEALKLKVEKIPTYFPLMRIEGKLKIGLIVCWCKMNATAAGEPRWRSTAKKKLQLSDQIIAIRMDKTNRYPRHYYLLPSHYLPKIISLPIIQGLQTDELLYKNIEDLCLAILGICQER